MSEDEAVRCAKDGADFVVVGDFVIRAEDPGLASRTMSEKFRRTA